MTQSLTPVDLRGPDSRSRGGLVTLWVAIVAMLATAVFGLATVGDEADASEPADAVKRLLRAASDSDVLGAMEAVLPAERAIIRKPLTDLASESKRLGLLSSDNLSHIDGVDLDFADVHMTTSSLADGIAAVRVDGGKVTSIVDPRRLPIGPTLTDAGADLSGERPETEVTNIADDPLELVTVRSDGKWYVSIAYSIAEGMRKAAGAPAPNFGNGLPAKGEPSAKGAVEATLRAALALDVERLIGLVSPGEGRALRDYAPLFIDDLKSSAAEARKSFSATVNKLELSGDESGSEARITLSAFDVAVKIEGETARFSFDGECTTFTAPGERPEKMCAKDALKALPFFGTLPEGAGLNKLTIHAVKADGAWFISPTRTMTGAILDITKLLDRKSLADLIKGFEEGFESESFTETGVSVGEA
jgi:hypothetical protein